MRVPRCSSRRRCRQRAVPSVSSTAERTEGSTSVGGRAAWVCHTWKARHNAMTSRGKNYMELSRWREDVLDIHASQTVHFTNDVSQRDREHQ